MTYHICIAMKNQRFVNRTCKETFTNVGETNFVYRTVDQRPRKRRLTVLLIVLSVVNITFLHRLHAQT